MVRQKEEFTLEGLCCDAWTTWIRINTKMKVDKQSCDEKVSCLCDIRLAVLGVVVLWKVERLKVGLVEQLGLSIWSWGGS